MLVVTGLSRSCWIGRIEARDLGRDRTLRRPTRQYVTHDDGTVDANGVCDSTPFAWRGESGGRSSIACAPLLLGRPRVQGRCTRFRSMQAGPRPDRSQPRSIGPALSVRSARLPRQRRSSSTATPSSAAPPTSRFPRPSSESIWRSSSSSATSSRLETEQSRFKLPPVARPVKRRAVISVEGLGGDPNCRLRQTAPARERR